MENAGESAAHDKLRQAFAECGLRVADGRSPLEWSDEEVEAAVAQIVKAGARFREAVRAAAIRRMTVRLETALRSIAADPALMAELKRVANARARRQL